MRSMPSNDSTIAARSSPSLGPLIGPLLLGCWVSACASGIPLHDMKSKDFGFKSDGQVWVRGPWEKIHPSRDVDEVIDQLCPTVIKLPRARLKEYGQEYCGLIYSLGEGLYYASAPSPLSSPVLRTESNIKSCFPPRYVQDGRGKPSPIADFHSHPWAPSPMSNKDKLQATQRWLIRIQFDTACHVQKLVPNVDNERPGEMYERLGKSWALIGYIRPEDKVSGFVTPVEETP
jgi:hypothetical protein